MPDYRFNRVKWQTDSEGSWLMLREAEKGCAMRTSSPFLGADGEFAAKLSKEGKRRSLDGVGNARDRLDYRTGGLFRRYRYGSCVLRKQPLFRPADVPADRQSDTGLPGCGDRYSYPSRTGFAFVGLGRKAEGGCIVGTGGQRRSLYRRM